MPPQPRPFQATPLSGPLRGAVRAPGDRKVALRALLLAAVAMGETRLDGLPVDAGLLRAAAAMRALGADIVPTQAEGLWRVAGRGVGGLAEPAQVLHAGHSDSLARLLAGLLASHPLFAVLTGGTALRGRSMRDVIGPLAACGARLVGRVDGGLPLTVEGASDALPLDCALPSSAKGAALLCGLNAPGVTELTEPTASHDHAENLLRHFGAEVAVERTGDGAGRVIRLHGQPHLRAADLVVPGDPSLAAFPLLAAVLTPGSTVTVENVGLNPLRCGLFETLREMGATLRVERPRTAGGEPVGDLLGEHSALHGIDIPAARAPTMAGDAAILAVAAAAARGSTRLRGVTHARIAGVAAMLAANGVRVETLGDDLLVHGTGAAPAGGALVAASGDGRIAMAALVLGLVSAAPVRVDDAGPIAACHREFVATMNRLVAGAPALVAA